MMRLRAVLRNLKPIYATVGFLAALAGLYEFGKGNPGFVTAIAGALFELPMRWVLLATATLVVFMVELANLLPDGRTLSSVVRLHLTVWLIGFVVASLLPAPRTETEWFVVVWIFGSYIYLIWRAERVDPP